MKKNGGNGGQIPKVAQKVVRRHEAAASRVQETLVRCLFEGMLRRKWSYICVALILLVGVAWWWMGTGANTKGLRVELVVTNADIGIPGVSKMYEARLVNRASWPIRVSYCDFVDDSSAPGQMVAYDIQRWEDKRQRWTTVVETTPSSFCRPYPLGIISAKSTSGLLWPGQSLSTGEEATAARSAFNVGDKARFVVFAGRPGDYSMSFSSSDFAIDEHPQTDIPLRIRH